MAKAVYKGHLASFNTTATASNNSRKLIQGRNRIWNLVYQDNNLIYYTNSDDDGETWTPEVRLSTEDQFTCSNPCIEFQRSMGEEEDPHYIGVVWDQEYFYQSNILHKPVFRYKHGTTSNVWEDELEWGSISGNSELNSKPVLAGTWHMDREKDEQEERFYILCKSNNGLALLVVWRIDDHTSLIKWLDPLSGTQSSSNNPTITSTKYRDINDDNFLYFAWDHAGQIRYSYYNIQSGGFPTEPDILAYTSSSNLNSKPCISFDDERYINVVWEHFNGMNQTTIQHRRKSIEGEWGPINEISCYGHNLFNPSVGAYKDSPEGELIVSATMTPSSIQPFHFDGYEWQIMSESESEGNYASLNDADDELMSVWTNSVGEPPYLVQNNTFLSGDNFLEHLNWSKRKYRKIQFNLSSIATTHLSGDLTVQIDSIKIVTNQGIQNWSYVALNDSLIHSRFFNTSPIQITPEMNDLLVFYSINGENCNLPSTLPTFPLLSLQLWGNSSIQPSAIMKNLSFSSLTPGSFAMRDSIRFKLNSFIGQTISFKLAGIFERLTMKNKTLIEKTEFNENSSLGTENLIANQSNLEVVSNPTEFHLYSNYPNPFNPNTTITFDLPEVAVVSLVIYDINGRQIKTLTSSRYQAGSHQIQWDGRDDSGNAVASGIYVYRIEAGKYVQSRKLMLLK